MKVRPVTPLAAAGIGLIAVLPSKSEAQLRFSDLPSISRKGFHLTQPGDTETQGSPRRKPAPSSSKSQTAPPSTKRIHPGTTIQIPGKSISLPTPGGGLPPISRPGAGKTGSPQVSEMVKVLKGDRASPGGGTGRLTNRTVTIDPRVLPKGSPRLTLNPPHPTLKSGKTPAHGRDGTQGGGATLFMKKGQEKAHGEGGLASHLNSGGGTAHHHGAPGHGGHHSGGHPVPLHGGGIHHDPGFSGGFSGPITYRVDESARLSTSEIKFLKNSTELADQYSYHYLHSLASALLSPDLIHESFVVEGHASAEGSFSTNQLLSQRRANAIYDFLVSMGVHPSRLLSVGHGESQARYPAGAAEYLRASDRRVIVFKLAR